ncbi:MAG: phosphatidylglycerol lysyltransferase domain-containing protein [Oscillospiraceae bacterium]|nr:phosphatidylglycerol lysyltransferase domain-containing protein [Oscillospiraceae bacterium]
MLDLKPMRLEDGDTYRSYTKDLRSSENSFTAVFGWMHKSKMLVCERDGLFFRFSDTQEPLYMFPLSREPMNDETMDYALSLMRWDADERGKPLVIGHIIEEQAEFLRDRSFDIKENRDYADYLYNASDLLELSGRKYHAKRNYIARFQREYNWRYEDITNDNLNDVWDFQERWCRKNNCEENVSLQEEATSIALMLYNLENLKAKGGLLKVDDKVVAFTVASRVGYDTLEVHIEKADYDVVGSYPMINREFLRHNLTPDIKYINREEDLGLENLKKAKMSYNPCRLLMKYTAV